MPERKTLNAARSIRLYVNFFDLGADRAGGSYSARFSQLFETIAVKV
jgi:hypothetical protein